MKAILKNGDELLLLNLEENYIECKIQSIFVQDNNTEIKDTLNIKKINEINLQIPIILKMNTDINIKPGSPFYKYDTETQKVDNIQKLEKYKSKYLTGNKIKLDKQGVQINAKTFNSAIALAELCNKKNINVSKISVGDIKKIDILKLRNMNDNFIKNEDDLIYNKRYLTIFAYDTNISEVLEKLAESLNIKIIKSSIIYEFVKEYNNYEEILNETLRKKHENIKPQCQFKILDKFIFHKKTPLIFGVKVIKNTICIGMSIETTINKKNKIKILKLGKIIGIEKNNKIVSEATENEIVCVKIEQIDNCIFEYGKDFNSENILVSHLDNYSIELLNKYGSILMGNREKIEKN